MLGVATVTTATIFWLFLLPTTLRGGETNPYIGILSYVVLPMFFFGGLAPVIPRVSRSSAGARSSVATYPLGISAAHLAQRPNCGDW